MTETLGSPTQAGTTERVPTPPSLLATGLRLSEARWAAVALVLFLAGWITQLAGAPGWAWWALYLACYVAGGWGPARSGLAALRQRTMDVDLLMIVAAIAAASIGQVFDGALLIVIFATSGALEAIVTQRTADSVSSLLDLAPEEATVIRADGSTTVVRAQDLAVDQTILVRPGERIGADGTVVAGSSEVDQQAITGESVPVLRTPGDEVLSGTVNGTGTLRVRVGRPAAESVIARIVHLVEEASATKARRQLFIEKVEQRYSVGVVIATLLVFGVPWLLFSAPFDAALLRAITFMIVASPCAVVLSTMPPLLAAIANAGRNGVLVKSATVMENIGKTTTVAFDKTGTLTVGAPHLTEVVTADGAGSTDQVLALAAAVEQHSEHPLAHAVVRAARERGIPIAEPTEVQALPGHGVHGVVDGRQVSVRRGERESEAIGTVVDVRADARLVGSITLTDEIRPDAADTVRAVTALTGQPARLLTGDNRPTAAHVAEHTGVPMVHAELLPEDKTGMVAELENGGHRVLLVGDGINDAPALASASVGVAMGRRGSDIALDTADAVIVRDELTRVPGLLRLSRRAHRLVVANLTIAATFITVLVGWDLLATLPLPLAVAGHEGSTVVVALNGLRLLRARP